MENRPSENFYKLLSQTTEARINAAQEARLRLVTRILKNTHVRGEGSKHASSPATIVYENIFSSA